MMTRRRLAAFVVKLMLATLSVGHVCVGQVKSTPEFTVRAQKESFKLGEKVVLVFHIENITHHSVLVSRIFALDKHVLLKISNAEGQQAVGCGKINGTLTSSRHFAVLRPGAAVERAVTISCEKRRVGGYKLDQPGKYTAVATYYLSEPTEVLKDFAGEAKVWKGPSVATAVEFRIGHPASRPSEETDDERQDCRR